MKRGKFFALLVIALIAITGKTAFAKEVYYTNSSGVEFTKEEYDFFTYLTWDGYQEYIPQEMLDEIKGKSINDPDVKRVKICPTSKRVVTRNSNPEVTTDTRSLIMGKYCNSVFCRVLIDLTWFDEPFTKSNDVVGSLLDGPTRLTTPTTTISSTTSSGTHSAIVYETDGFGTVVPLPTTGDNIHITQSYLYSGTGVIYYTYQHAMYNISTANAQLFHIDLVGYGNVLDFYGAAANIYDDMPGVYIEV